MDSAAPLDALRQILRDSARLSGGALSLARFVDIALYHPGLGYYERSPRRIGRNGDFFTSVNVGPVFGQLLARRFASWLREIPDPHPNRRQLVECGAHDGSLANDILGAIRESAPDLLQQLDYVIVEPSQQRCEWQAATLKDWGPLVRWARRLEPTHGVVFANELLDAFPVHRLAWDAARHRWFEWGVTPDRDLWRWCILPESHDSSIDTLLTFAGCHAWNKDVLGVLPDGYIVEVSPDAIHWWSNAAASLQSGVLFTCDYGYIRDPMSLAARAQGTFRGYRHHRLLDDPLSHPGDADLTSSVDFTAVEAAGRRAGLSTLQFADQGRFLTSILAGLGASGSESILRTPSSRTQFTTLTHPEQMGTRFKVLAQQRRASQS